MGFALSKGILSYITPNKWLSIPYGRTLRDNYVNHLYSICDCRNVKVFEAGNEPIISFFTKDDSLNVNVARFTSSYKVNSLHLLPLTSVDKDCLGILISDNIDILLKIKSFSGQLRDFVKVENPFTTSEAYDLIPLVSDSANSVNAFRLVNTGTIDPYICMWGKMNTTYLRTKYTHPVISKDDFKEIFPRRLYQAQSSKIVISGMRNFEAFLDDTGKYLAGKSTIVVMDKEEECENWLLFILAILNSKLITFYIKQSYSTLGIGGGINFSKEMVELLPIPPISKETKCKIEDMASKLLDVVKSNESDNIDEWKDSFSSNLLGIDILIYELYDLSYDEVLLIDSQVPCSRVEYDNL